MKKTYVLYYEGTGNTQTVVTDKPEKAKVLFKADSYTEVTPKHETLLK